VRGDVGVPRISAKLERWDESGLGLDDILSAGGGVRPIDDTELLIVLSSIADSDVSIVSQKMRGARSYAYWVGDLVLLVTDANRKGGMFALLFGRRLEVSSQSSHVNVKWLRWSALAVPRERILGCRMRGMVLIADG
jgi:hypothetical protein